MPSKSFILHEVGSIGKMFGWLATFIRISGVRICLMPFETQVSSLPILFRSQMTVSRAVASVIF